MKKSSIQSIFAHAAYLINLAGPDPKKHLLSKQSMLGEMERAEQLGLSYVVLHPGNHMESTEEEGMEKISKSLSEILYDTKGGNVQILLETSAGQGSSVGHTIEQLAFIWEHTHPKSGLGICLDTCHLFASGYDIREKGIYTYVINEVDHRIGLEHLKAFHLNDSKKPLRSRVDRHAHIGEGHIGVEPFRWILQDPRFKNLPMVLETPKEGGDSADRKNLTMLQNLLSEKG